MFLMHVTCDMHTTLYSQYCDMHVSLNMHESCVQHVHYMQEISTRDIVNNGYGSLISKMFLSLTVKFPN